MIQGACVKVHRFCHLKGAVREKPFELMRPRLWSSLVICQLTSLTTQIPSHGLGQPGELVKTLPQKRRVVDLNLRPLHLQSDDLTPRPRSYFHIHREVII